MEQQQQQQNEHRGRRPDALDAGRREKAVKEEALWVDLHKSLCSCSKCKLLLACKKQGFRFRVSHPGELLASGDFQKNVTWEINNSGWVYTEEGGMGGAVVGSGLWSCC